MQIPNMEAEHSRGGQARLPSTLWTLVLTARDLNAPNARAALAELCGMYWYPLYAFVRRQGRAHHQAQDLTQAFFEHLFAQENWLGGVDKGNGRFRTFLLCSLSNFLSNERAKERAAKRGGGPKRFVSWDPELAEAKIAREQMEQMDPARQFDCLWAAALVERAVAILKEEYRRCDKTELYTALSPFLTRPVPQGHYAALALQLGKTEGALRIAMHRLVQRFGELVRARVAQTVSGPESVDDELRAVLKSWARES